MVEEEMQPTLGDGRIQRPTGFSSKTSAMDLSRTIRILKWYTSAVFDHTKFKKRLKSLQKSAVKLLSRAEMDETRFEGFVSKHTISLFSHKGYIQWQGSDAQKKLQIDISNNMHWLMALESSSRRASTKGDNNKNRLRLLVVGNARNSQLTSCRDLAFAIASTCRVYQLNLHNHKDEKDIFVRQLNDSILLPTIHRDILR